MVEVTATVAQALPLLGVNVAEIGVAELVLATLMVCAAGNAPVAAIWNVSEDGFSVSRGEELIVKLTWIVCRDGVVPGASTKIVAVCLPGDMLPTTCVFSPSWTSVLVNPLVGEITSQAGSDGANVEERLKKILNDGSVEPIVRPCDTGKP